MATTHTVVQGEHLSRIAKRYGFTDYRTVWEHGNNAELRRRRNPNVLFPGDQVYIPDRETREESRVTDQRHRFVTRIPTLKLRLELEDLYERPIADAPCELHLDGQVRQLTTDGRGRIELEIPIPAEHGRLIVKTTATPLDRLAIPIEIGHLDPVEETSGQIARLTNLGYHFTPVTPAQSPADFRLAVEEFQCDHGLIVDGVCGPQTQAKLKAVHGS
jgi:N-acetylmuramoyl-L-alanine amidase